MAKKRFADVVVLLPGISGSVLQKNGRDVWAPSGQAIWSALSSFGSSLHNLVLQDDDPEADDLGDGITAPRVVPDVHMIPGLVKIDGYSDTIRMITDNFEVVQGSIHEDAPANFFAFPYDWRRDNRVSARKLKQLIDRKLPQWRQHSGAHDAKVIFLAHSMGGLIARYYLEVLEGWRDCKALITFGTPYRGSINAANFLVNGYKAAFLDLSHVLRSFTSVYQLLPIYKAIKSGTSYERVAEVSGIPGIERTRAEQALAFHREIEAAVEAHRRDPVYLNQGYKILPVVGTRQPTWQSAELVNGRLTVGNALPPHVDAGLGEGDGTVSRLSAVPIEMSQEYRDSYVAERHASLQRSAIVLDDLRGRLEQMQVKNLETIRGPQVSRATAEQAAISLDLEDLYLPGEPVELRAKLINVSSPGGTPTAQIDPVGAETPTVIKEFHEEGDTWVLREEGLRPGLYRVTVRTSQVGSEMPTPVHDLFEIAA